MVNQDIDRALLLITSIQTETKKPKNPKNLIMSFNGTKTHNFPINARHIGFVIGKGGATIKMIKHKSGAYVQIRQADPAKGLKLPYFEVIGSEGQCQRAEELLTQIANEAAHREQGGAPTLGRRPAYQAPPMVYSTKEFPTLPSKPKFIPDAQDQLEIERYLNSECAIDAKLVAIRAEMDHLTSYNQWKRDAGVTALCQSEVDDMADDHVAALNRAQGDLVDNAYHPEDVYYHQSMVSGPCYPGYPMMYWNTMMPPQGN